MLMMTTSFSAAISCIRNASPDLVEKAKNRSDIKWKIEEKFNRNGKKLHGTRN
jgi:hypothetical protein